MSGKDVRSTQQTEQRSRIGSLCNALPSLRLCREKSTEDLLVVFRRLLGISKGPCRYRRPLGFFWVELPATDLRFVLADWTADILTIKTEVAPKEQVHSPLVLLTYLWLVG